MESRLQFDWEQSSEAIALISLGGKEESIFSLVQSLVSEASVKYPQLSHLRFVHVPLPIAKLESWSYYLAAQLVAQWRELPLTKHSVDVVRELGLSNAESRDSFFTALNGTTLSTPLTTQLTVRIESLKQPRQQQRVSEQRLWLERETTQLAQWFTSPTEENSCSAQLQFNVIALRTKILGQLQGYFDQMQLVGSRSLLMWLNSLSESFDGIRANYEAQRQDSLRRESSAWRAYYNLNPQIEGNWRLFDRDRLDWQAILSALTTAYNFKLKAEIYTQAAQLVGELAQKTRLYANSVQDIDALFARMQNYFSDRGAVESLFLPLLKNFLAERVNIMQLRAEIENWAGCQCDRWHTLESSHTTALREQILLRIRPLCLEVYAECCRCVLNLEFTNRQERTAPSEPILSNVDKRIGLQVQNADIQDVLELLAKKGHVCVVADRTISGTISLSLNEVTFTEAVAAVAAAANLTYTKNSNIYTFHQLFSKNSPAIVSENSNVYTFNRE
jgi:hypothetical protein